MDDIDGKDQIEAVRRKLDLFDAPLSKVDAAGSCPGAGEHLRRGVDAVTGAAGVSRDGGDVITGATTDFENGRFADQVGGCQEGFEHFGMGAAVPGVLGRDLIVVDHGV